MTNKWYSIWIFYTSSMLAILQQNKKLSSHTHHQRLSFFPCEMFQHVIAINHNWNVNSLFFFFHMNSLITTALSSFPFQMFHDFIVKQKLKSQHILEIASQLYNKIIPWSFSGLELSHCESQIVISFQKFAVKIVTL